MAVEEADKGGLEERDGYLAWRGEWAEGEEGLFGLELPWPKEEARMEASGDRLAEDVLMVGRPRVGGAEEGGCGGGALAGAAEVAAVAMMESREERSSDE